MSYYPDIYAVAQRAAEEAKKLARESVAPEGRIGPNGYGCVDVPTVDIPDEVELDVTAEVMAALNEHPQCRCESVTATLKEVCIIDGRVYARYQTVAA